MKTGKAENFSLDYYPPAAITAGQTECSAILCFTNNNTEAIAFNNKNLGSASDAPPFDSPNSADMDVLYVQFDYADNPNSICSPDNRGKLTMSNYTSGETFQFSVFDNPDEKDKIYFAISSSAVQTVIAAGDSVKFKIGIGLSGSKPGVIYTQIRFKDQEGYADLICKNDLQKCPLPVIKSFGTSSTGYHIGDSIDLTWEVDDANSCTFFIDGREVLSGKPLYTVHNIQAKDYVLNIQNIAGNIVTASFTPSFTFINSFYLTPNVTVDCGTLHWDTVKENIQEGSLKITSSYGQSWNAGYSGTLSVGKGAFDSVSYTLSVTEKGTTNIVSASTSFY